MHPLLITIMLIIISPILASLIFDLIKLKTFKKPIILVALIFSFFLLVLLLVLSGGRDLIYKNDLILYFFIAIPIITFLLLQIKIFKMKNLWFKCLSVLATLSAVILFAGVFLFETAEIDIFKVKNYDDGIACYEYRDSTHIESIYGPRKDSVFLYRPLALFFLKRIEYEGHNKEFDSLSKLCDFEYQILNNN